MLPLRGIVCVCGCGRGRLHNLYAFNDFALVSQTIFNDFI